jgi:hypothetical protein
MPEIVRWLDATFKNNLSDRNLTTNRETSQRNHFCVVDNSFHGRLAILFPE